MILKKVGFFRELPYGSPNSPSIHEMHKSPLSDFEEVLTYLQSGILFIASPGIEYDVLASSRVTIGSPNIYTDGTWAWPESLSYYLKKYFVELPLDFLEHIRSRRYSIPNPAHVDLGNLELQE